MANCKCEEFKGSTTIMCCNECKLPLKNEPWSIPESSVKTIDVLLAIIKYHKDIVEGHRLSANVCAEIEKIGEDLIKDNPIEKKYRAIVKRDAKAQLENHKLWIEYLEKLLASKTA